MFDKFLNGDLYVSCKDFEEISCFLEKMLLLGLQLPEAYPTVKEYSNFCFLERKDLVFGMVKNDKLTIRAGNKHNHSNPEIEIVTFNEFFSEKIVKHEVKVIYLGI